MMWIIERRVETLTPAPSSVVIKGLNSDLSYGFTRFSFFFILFRQLKEVNPFIQGPLSLSFCRFAVGLKGYPCMKNDIEAESSFMFVSAL